MNAERLLAHFERISEAPDAISRLRRFILDLAVRGKLVEQDPEDEPAVELLKAISLDSLQSKGRRTAAAVCSGIAIEGSFKVPGSWVWTLLGGIGDWGSGSTPPRGRADYYSGDISWFKSGELGDNKSLSVSEEKITHLALGECSFRLNKPGDILIAMYGATIGKLAILAEEAVTNQAVCACTPCWGVDTQYLYLFLLAKRDDFRLASEGGAQPNISKVKIVNTPIPLPPLAEQHRIVAKVDELMALCDQLEAARQQREQGSERLVAATLQRLNQPAADPASFRQDASFALQVLPSLTTTPAQVKQLRQTILNLAVRGKLVEQDPEDEPAEELLAGVAEEKVRKSSNRSRKADAIMSDDSADLKLFSLHKGWQWTTLEEYSLDVSTGPFGSMLHQADYIVNGIPVVNPSHMIGGRICPDLKVTISPGMADRLESYKLTAGDIVMARRGEVGRAALVTEKEEGWLCGTGSFIVRFIPESLRAYVLLFLSADLARSYLLGSAIGATMTNLNHGILKKMPIPLPPLAEQHRIVAKVDELMALCDQLEQQLSQADQQRRRLLEAVLAEALGGRLPTGQEESHANVA
jgi:type I restriction enzyme S subunit